MGRTKEQQREYMAAYRARKKFAAFVEPTSGAVVIDANKRIAELEAEVAHLKRELAARPSTILPAGEMRPVVAEPIGHAFNSRPFTPAPKR